MTKVKRSLLKLLPREGTMRRWRKAAQQAPSMPLDRLHRKQMQAQKLRHHLDALIRNAEKRLTPPRPQPSLPHGTDWIWWPAPWREALDIPGRGSVHTRMQLCEDLTLFHDCPLAELILRQVRNPAHGTTPFGLCLDVFGFSGSLLSLAIDLPDAALASLRKRHLIRLDAKIETERPQTIYARLNIRHGPNIEQIVRELQLHHPDIMIEFDLGPSDLDEGRIEQAWLDLIFDDPGMNRILLHTLAFSSAPRAEF